MTSYEVSMELWDDNHALHLFSVRGEAAARTVHVQLKEQGNAVDLTGKEVRVYMLTPNGSRIFSKTGSFLSQLPQRRWSAGA